MRKDDNVLHMCSADCSLRISDPSPIHHSCQDHCRSSIWKFFTQSGPPSDPATRTISSSLSPALLHSLYASAQNHIRAPCQPDSLDKDGVGVSPIFGLNAMRWLPRQSGLSCSLLIARPKLGFKFRWWTGLNISILRNNTPNDYTNVTLLSG